jgi:hypothetical protein
MSYSSPILRIPEKAHATPAKIDFAVTAALNRLLILRDPSHPQHTQAQPLLAQVKPYAEDHPNQYLRIAFRLIAAFHAESTTSILQQKKTVQAAVGLAQEISKRTLNFEFVAMMMCYFVARFFADTVGEKSIQAIRAARSQAGKVRRGVWMGVASGIAVGVYACNGMGGESVRAARVWEGVRGSLPAPLRGGGVEEEEDAEGEDDDAEGEEEDGELDADGDIDVVG